MHPRGADRDLPLPGLSFSERPRLFSALLDTVYGSREPVEVTMGGRPALVVVDPEDVRFVLGSAARKGRPAATLQGVRSYMAAESSLELARRRAAVMAALGKAAQTTSGASPSSNGSTSGVATSLMADLAGTRPSPHLAGLCEQALHSLRAMADGQRRTDEQLLLERTCAQLQKHLDPTAPFVRALTQRGWSTRDIAAEVVTLTFAGWASLTAALRTSATLGLGGANVSDGAITELLRIAPPGWLITRETVGSTMLPSSRAPLAEGQLLVFSPWLLQRAPEHWERPEMFDADRKGTRRNAAYLPFSTGKRGCPAERYSRAFLHRTLLDRTSTRPSPTLIPALTDERSACLLSPERQPS